MNLMNSLSDFDIWNFGKLKWKHLSKFLNYWKKIAKNQFL